MAKLVVQGATIACSMGSSPGTLSVAPTNETFNGSNAAASVQDMKPQVNIAPFGACSSPSNPQVAAATSAAAGVLTPQPCLPVVVGPWTPGASSVEVGGQPALTDACQCACQWAGQITVQSAGQTEIEVE